jgi:hypothetical protein
MGRLRIALMLTLAIAGQTAAVAQQRDGRWAILVSGISGDPNLQKELLTQLTELRSILENQLEFPKDRVFVLFDDPAKAGGAAVLKSNGENLQKVARDVASRADKDDLLFVYLAGHGNFDGKTYKLNLVGPDPTAEQLAAMLYAIPSERVVIANMTTCSGGSIPALARPGKVLITATKSGNEKNQTRLGRYFIEALKNNNGDVDKNGRVSLLEAFTYGARKVEEYYSKEGALQTEHPVVEDDGDGQPHDKPEPENGDGLLARVTYLDAGPVRTARGGSPEEQQLSREVESLERQIEALKYAKSTMPEPEYEKKLEALLLKLAATNAKLRNRQ